MSIYSTWLHLSAHDEHDPSCARWVSADEESARARGNYMIADGPDGPGGAPRFAFYEPANLCSCANEGPLVYRGSHLNPLDSDPRGGSLEVGVIPNHCHPDVRGTGADEGPPVEFLRLCVDEDPSTYHGGEPGSATIVLDRAQVERLRDTLGAWLSAEERW